jgi:streptogramin lyase
MTHIIFSQEALTMTFGTGKYTYQAISGWGKPPEGWTWGWIPAVACDSQDRVYVYSRSENPLVVFDRDGNFLETWGDGILPPKAAHGIYIDDDDNVYCIDNANHCVFKFNRDGELVMTLGTPGQRAEKDGEPFSGVTDLDVASTGELFISDGYGNARVHKYSPDGELLLSWGERGDGPGQFALSHCVRIDKDDRVWICDRENNRLQIFDTDGNFLTEWTGLLRPNTIYFDPNDDVVYIAELTHQVSIYTLDRELITKWGGAESSEKPGEFRGGPHGLWMDSHGDLYMGEVELGIEGRMHKYVRQ